MLDSCLGLDYRIFDNGNVRYDGGISFMKSGILYADKVTTVSPSYSQEILTPQYGEHMEMVLEMRRYDLWGITNGIDIESWNPKTDPEIPYHFNKVNVKKQKAANKMALQQEMGLQVNPDVMLVGVVSRLTWQKGFYLLMENCMSFVRCRFSYAYLVVVRKESSRKWRSWKTAIKEKSSFIRAIMILLAHRIYAASDLFLMPSLFEPCGISQLIPCVMVHFHLCVNRWFT